MQGGLHHHQHQQLAALLSVALPNDDSSTAHNDSDESTRLSAINSLHRLVLYPPNSVLVAHSSTFLFQSLSQLLLDKSYSVRQLAATTYGAFCSVLCSIQLGSNGRKNHVLGTLVDRFINWALPLLSNSRGNDGSKELALESLREFLSVADVGATERYAFPILKACQELLEDERTSLNLLHPLLGVLTMISLKFFRCFQPHFIDIVDLLLGWAMVPDIAESDRLVIMGSFLQFQKYWVSNLQFPLGLLSKFLGDMEVLLQDGSSGTPKQFKRLLALLSCFSTILRSTASGLLEMNVLEQIIEPLGKMIPQLLECLSMVGEKFGWLNLIEDLWKSLTLLAEILGEKFSAFYPLVVDVLFQSLKMEYGAQPVKSRKVTPLQIHGVLKTNLQLLSLQKLGFLPSSAKKILKFDAPISRLRLHPNHLVTSSAAATYIFLLQHGNDEVVEHAINTILEELTLLNGMLEKVFGHADADNNFSDVNSYSKLELFALIKFDLKVLLCCVCLGRIDTLNGKPDMASLLLKRSHKLIDFIILKLHPLNSRIKSCVELQLDIIDMLSRLTSVELFSVCSICSNKKDSAEKSSGLFMNGESIAQMYSKVVFEHLTKYCSVLVGALDNNSPAAVKVKSLDWIGKFCQDVITIYENLNANVNPSEEVGCGSAVWTLVFSILGAASDREPKVRSQVAVVFDLLLQAKLVHPRQFYPLAEVVLEKLGDTNDDIRSVFMRRFSDVLPVTVYACGFIDSGMIAVGRYGLCKTRPDLHWRQLFALKKLPQHLRPQQLVSILSYISQRWKAPLPSWVQRLIQHGKSLEDSVTSPPDETGSSGGNALWLDMNLEPDFLERISLVNNLAAIWWAIHEAARYCTATRLRTNLGGPTQTFAALERMLLDVGHILQLDTEHSDGSLSIVGSSGAHLLPMRLLLDFVEALKKNVYNAYDGSSVLPCASRQSSLFFRANKKVCEEWFSRICEPMMNAGLALQCHDAIIQYCTLRLQELSNSLASSLKDKPRAQLHNIRGRFAGDIMKTVRHMALALCRKHDPVALVGLQKWLHLTFSSLLMEEEQTLDSAEISVLFSWLTGLVYQAEEQYEKAAAFFTHLLQIQESLSFMGADGVQFIIARLIESYTAISDWESLESWLLELQALRSMHAGKSYSGALTTAGNEMNAIHALANFDKGDLQASWTSLDLTSKSSSELTLDPKLALQRSEQMLLQAMLYQRDGKMEMVPHETQKAKSLLDEIMSVLPLDGLVEGAPYAIQLHCIYALEEACRLNGIVNNSKQSDSVINTFSLAVHSPISRLVQDCNSWMKVFRVYRTILPASPATLLLCKNLTSLSRKQRNLGLANHLKSYLRDNIHNCSDASYFNFLASSLRYEEILLLHAENKLVDAFTNIWSYVRPCFLSQEVVDSAADDIVLKAKACLKFTSWLRHSRIDVSLENIILDIHTDLSTSDGSNESTGEETLISRPNIALIIEEIIGAAAKLSTRLCPVMGKSWISYATWCFSQAKDNLSHSHKNALPSFSCPILGQEIVGQRSNLTDDEMLKVESVISQLLQRSFHANPAIEGEERHLQVEPLEDTNNVNHVKVLVQKINKVFEAAAGAPAAENFVGESLSDMLVSQLRMTILAEVGHVEENMLSSCLDGLVDVWWSLRKRRVSLFGLAAYGFIQYLSHSCSRLSGGPSIDFDCGFANQKTGSLILRATLYILHILLNYGVELKDRLECSLSAVPLLPWQEIVPQLFARLSSHPEHAIRKMLEGLLVTLARFSPWSIVYPTLVDVNACDEEPTEELQHILACLMKLYPRLVQEVKLIINELGNVTVLWEELWLSTLQDLHGDVMRRISLLKEEAARVADNVTLSHGEKIKINAAKYSAMMAPIVVALERRLALISRNPETPHEKWFQDEYKEPLRSAIISFKTPPSSSAVLGDVWRPFVNIASSLASYQRKSSVSLEEVAPELAHLSSSEVPMPGLEKLAMVSESDGNVSTSFHGIVTVASFSEQVAILSTKTKPKKLGMLGSDGEKYTYLLKGREDLRLDARIMQLLQTINSFLLSSSETRTRCVGIRYYSVTPISGRAGLIQWVDNVISIYGIFKSWQQRVQLAQLSATGGNMINSAPPPVPRPSDMFYGKIIPALKEKGIRRVISRRDWPHEVKRKVLVDLIKEAPQQLLHQELWCASEDFRAFNTKLKRYSGSLAAMSMVGHILGLGDRHLDNIMIDFLSGDIIHIDYNVCFDKGKRLKVPEIVPFRLTQTLEAALGLTGIEGVFRANCEAVMGVLRRNKDVLLMLLDVFVWDPLVEWTRGDFHDDAAIGGEERKGMELAVSLSLFVSRMQEIRVPLQEHHDLLLASVPAVESSLKRFLEVLNQYELVSDLFFRADQERSTLLLHETSARSLMAEATSNSEKIRALYEIQAREFEEAKAVVTEKAQEATTWIEQHGTILDALRSGSILEINTSIKLSGTEVALSLVSAVSAAGVPLTVVPEPTQVQCHDMDREISQLISELAHGVSCAVTLLQAYSLALQKFLPLNYLTTSPVHGWAQVLQLSVNTLSSDMLSHARRQAGDLIAKAQGAHLDTVKRTHDDLCLRVEKYALEIQKIEQEYAELVNSIGSEAEINAKDHLLSSFMNYMQSIGLVLRKSKKESAKHPQGELDVKEKILSVLYAAVCSLYDDMKHKVVDTLEDVTGIGSTSIGSNTDFGALFCGLEEQTDKCLLVMDFVNELRQTLGVNVATIERDVHFPEYSSEGNWASITKAIFLSCKDLVIHMTEVVLPEVIRCVLSFNSDVMDAFGAVSHIRGSIETALEQLVEVESERASLEELEKSYFLKVGLITEQQLALEEAAMKGRDHLSWEEAEELASQEEACRAQLDHLHQTWSQKDMRASSLVSREAGIKDALLSSERHFTSRLSLDEKRGAHGLSSKDLLCDLEKPFSKLESLDKALTVSCGATSRQRDVSIFANFLSSGCQMLEYIWKFQGLLSGHDFFVWKVGVVDLILDSTMHEVSLYIDQNLGFDQLVDIVKKKLVIQLQVLMGQYLKERISPALLLCLGKEIENFNTHIPGSVEFGFDNALKGNNAVKRVQAMLEEFCNAHETVRAARSAASVMRRQVNDLKEAISRTIQEIFRVEWMHDVTLNPSHKSRVISQNFLETNDKMYLLVLNLTRQKFLEGISSALSMIARSIESLESCERTSVTAEGQLERAMNWACGGPSSSMSGNSGNWSSGIPPEFHDHLRLRRQLLWEAREKASDIMKLSLSIMEFEASRDGILCTPGEIFPFRTGADGKKWQEAYLNALTRLDVTFHSFSRTEQEWKLAQSSMEAASSGLFSASSELSVASVKAKSASGDLQGTLLQMRDCAYEASVALSAFSRIVRGHTVLTSECGSMLEEVLAITDGLHEVHNLGKEAASVHHSLMEYISQASVILLPLESVLSKDVAAMTDAMARERETKKEISPIHGQAINQSYCSRIKEACQSFNPLVPMLMSSVKDLYSLLTRLAQTSSIHAGNLHKAVEGEEGGLKTRSQEVNLSREDFANDTTEYDQMNDDFLFESNGEKDGNLAGISSLSTQERGWISPPDSMYSSSTELGSASGEASSSDILSCRDAMENLSIDSNCKEVEDHYGSVPFSGTDEQEILQSVQSDSNELESNNAVTEPHDPVEAVRSPAKLLAGSLVDTVREKKLEFSLGDGAQASLSNKASSEGVSVNEPPPKRSAVLVTRGKNAIAMSVLRRVEMKLDGRDIAENGEVSIAEQVDYLLKQATSIDNLCNMYEGWTPWI